MDFFKQPTSLDGPFACSFHNWDRTLLKVAFLPSSPDSLYTQNLSVETSLPFPGDPVQDIKYLQAGVFFYCGSHVFHQKHSYITATYLKICILFWTHTWVFCSYCILVSWQSCSLTLPTTSNNTFPLIHDHSPQADR